VDRPGIRARAIGYDPAAAGTTLLAASEQIRAWPHGKGIAVATGCEFFPPCKALKVTKRRKNLDFA
jgi:hypothetical protein